MEALEEKTVEEIAQFYIDGIDSNLEIYTLEHNIDDLAQEKQSKWNAMLIYIYRHVFKPTKKTVNTKQSIIDYADVDLINILLKHYIELCQSNNKEVSLNGFCYMLGLEQIEVARYCEGNIYNNLSVAWCEIVKKLSMAQEESLRNKLFDSNNVTGQVVLVNHDFGYSGGIIKGQSLIGQSISSDALPKLSDNSKAITKK